VQQNRRHGPSDIYAAEYCLPMRYKNKGAQYNKNSVHQHLAWSIIITNRRCMAHMLVYNFIHYFSSFLLAPVVGYSVVRGAGISVAASTDFLVSALIWMYGAYLLCISAFFCFAIQTRPMVDLGRR
jgi:hypothetical protein